MTDEEKATLTATADAFLRTVKETSPDKLSTDHILRLCGWFIITYAENKAEAEVFVALLIRALTTYYDVVEPIANGNDAIH